MPGLEGGPSGPGRMCGGPWSIADFYQLLSHVLFASHFWLPSQKSYLIIKAAIGCLGFTSNQDKVVCKAFLVQKKAEVMVKGNLSLWPRSWAAWAGVWVCIGWLPVIYLFSWSKRRGKKGTQHGWDENTAFMWTLDLWEGKADHLSGGQPNGHSPSL